MHRLYEGVFVVAVRISRVYHYICQGQTLENARCTTALPAVIAIQSITVLTTSNTTFLAQNNSECKREYDCKYTMQGILYHNFIGSEMI